MSFFVAAFRARAAVYNIESGLGCSRISAISDMAQGNNDAHRLAPAMNTRLEAKDKMLAANSLPAQTTIKIILRNYCVIPSLFLPSTI
jgi:hypothetical protein